MGNKVYFWYNGYVENVEAYSNFPYALYASSISRCKEPSMTIKQPTTPILLKDLGMIYPNENSKTKYRYGLYLCECGNEFHAQTTHIKSGNTKSCGCYRKQRTSVVHTTHGLTRHPLYCVWGKMIDRTSNPSDKNFKYYGVRGITVCAEWRSDFKNFYDWCYENGYEKGLTVDRVDNDGNYEPSNCRLATRAVQAQNSRKIRTTNTSGYRGVSFRKDSRKWAAAICINGKNKRLGSFETALAAAIAYDTYVLTNNLDNTKNGVLLCKE